MIRAGGCFARFRHLAPWRRRSTTTVSWPRRTSAACRLEPMNPAPPVTIIMADVIGAAASRRKAPKRYGVCQMEFAAMSDRPRFFDDLAGVAGGALSALAGLREEAEALVRARLDEAIRRLDLVKREELEALAELAANA